MGQIVFQATLGGQTALVGQNTASSYSLTLPLATDTLVGKATTDTLTNKTLTAPVISSIVNTGTLTLPTSTDTLVGRATTDTLTNKTISGSNNTLSNISLTSSVTGTLPVGNGGTGLTSFTNTGIVYASSTSSLATSSALTWSGTSLAAVGTTSNMSVVTQATTAASYYQAQNSGQSLYVGLDNSTGSAFGSANAAFIYGSGNYPIVFSTNSNEKMRLTSAGYLGIGTSSPSNILTVNGGLELTSSSFVGSGSGFYLPASNSIGFVNGGTERMRLDSSGNLGLGVTPSAWSGFTALQVKSGSIWSDGGARTFWGNNEYFDGTNRRYIANGYAQEYIMDSNGTYVWKTAPSSTAGSVISFTQAMTLDNSGNLGIGTSSPAQKISINSANTSTNSLVNFQQGGTTQGYIGMGGDNVMRLQTVGTQPIGLQNDGAGFIFFNVNGSERARIDSSGNLLVGTTSGFGGIINAVSTGNPLYIKCTTSSQSVGVFWNSQNSTGTSAGLLNFGVGSSYTSVGTVTYNGTLTVYGTTSDQRLKTNIVDAPSGNIDAIKVRSFDWKESNTHQDYGLVAQELIEVAPYAVSKPDNADEMMNIDFSLLVPMMIKEIQDLKQRIATLENK